MDPSTKFLIGGAASLAVTATALRPPRKRWPSSLAYFVGTASTEFTFQSATVQLATAALLARRGGTEGWRGKLGIAAYAASMAGLAAIHRSALDASDVFDDALEEVFGPGYADRITAECAPGPVQRLTVAQTAFPNTRLRNRFRSHRDVSYGDHGVRNLLDIWKRSDLPLDARAPVLVQVHGGAWTLGKKDGQAQPLMAHLAERGWVCVAPTYRISPSATWPDHIVDVKRALAWTKANIADYGGDPDFVAITGGSAGGHLVALAALTPNDPAFQPGFEDADTSVVAAVPLYGVYDLLNRHDSRGLDLVELLTTKVFKSDPALDSERWNRASPIHHAAADAPPFFVVHGANDSVVPPEQARTFVAELRRQSRQPVAYAELPLTQHAFEMFPSVRANAAAHAVERFLAVVRSDHAAASARSATADEYPASDPSRDRDV